MSAKIVTPLLTIFNDDGSVDKEGNDKLINFLFDNGVDGVVVLGSTGEFTALDFETRKNVIKDSIAAVNKRGVVLAGTGYTTPQGTIELSNYALECGADGVLIIGEYYYGMSQDEIFHYYDYLAENINGNVYLYNFPARTGTDFEAETVLKLCRKHKNIVGMKESVGSFAHTRNIMATIQDEFPDFIMYSGFDEQFNDNVDFGGAGSIGAISNLFPKLWSDLVKAKNEKDYEKTVEFRVKVMKLMKLYDLESNCSGLFKEILKRMEILDVNTTTLFPFEKTSEEAIAQAIELIKKTV